MKKATLLGVLFTVLFANKLVFATSSYDLDGSNPIVLIHGILGFDDRAGLLNGFAKYWGGMDNDLRKEWPNNTNLTAYCSKVLTPGTSAAAHTSTRATDTALVVNQWMAACGYTKVNLIGHSQGGLVARWMAKNVSTIREKIKVVTTLNSVHQGTPTADFILGLVTGLPTWVQNLLTTVINKTFSLIYKDQNGDGRIDNQDVMTMGQSLTVSYMRGTFNTTCTNNTSTDGVTGNVRYYSYGSKMKCPILGNLCDDLTHHPIMGLTFPVTGYLGSTSKYTTMGFSADNDGIVPLYSQKWGTWKGEPDTNWFNNFTLTSGVDHLQATKMQLIGVVNGDFQETNRMIDMAVNAKNNQNF